MEARDESATGRRPRAARLGALTELQDLCPERFQPELVEQFAQAVGLFPSGCLVELSSGEVAVVFSQNTGRRLRPKVMLILDAAKRPRKTCPIIDLKAVTLVGWIELTATMLVVLAAIDLAWAGLAAHTRRVLRSPRALRLANRASAGVMAGAAAAIATR